MPGRAPEVSEQGALGTQFEASPYIVQVDSAITFLVFHSFLAMTLIQRRLKADFWSQGG